MFYNGVSPSTRQMIDAAAGGTINNKTPEEASEFIEEMSLNNYHWQVKRTKPTKIAGVYNVDLVAMLSNQVELLNKKIDGLLDSTQVHPAMRCDSSGGGVPTEYPPFNHTTDEEQVNYMGNNNFRSQNNPYSNTYNAGWKNHPNFSWGGQGNQRPQNFRISQLSKLISERPQGSLPINTEPNPREQLNAIDAQEGCVKTESEPRQENVESKGDGEMSNAMKFLKELLANKRKLDEASYVELNAVCSAILQNKLPNKLKDLGSFTIPCLIGELTLRVGDETVTLQARNSSITSNMECNDPHHLTKNDNMMQPTVQRLSLKEVHEPCSNNTREPIHEERRLQIEELDEW
ncbi:hypothetical protein CXB51_005293 [Gossypium anomalum]|uniref:Uncharacterized protein n=1 Tax=Gossypium anomalum TaxID=47600 RepID=A0A8J6D7V2_9ROSI|nr:hypothetical protein CXB51_005293 [Gossypium anomalum]